MRRNIIFISRVLGTCLEKYKTQQLRVRSAVSVFTTALSRELKCLHVAEKYFLALLALSAFVAQMISESTYQG